MITIKGSKKTIFVERKENTTKDDAMITKKVSTKKIDISPS